MRTLIIFLLFSSACIAQPLNPKELKDLRGSVSESCFTSQRSAKINNIVSDAQVRYYCTCYAQEIIPSTTTYQDFQGAIKAMQKSGNDAMVNYLLKGRSIYAIANSCSALAMQNAK